LRWATGELAPVTDTPRLEAEVLLAHVLETSRAVLIAHHERPLTPAQLDQYQALVRRRAANYPLPYLTGRIEFYGLEFEVTPDVLIPRPETETLVDLALRRRPARVVDVGTGSGCIAVSLAVHLPEVTVYAVDVSPAALAIARRNAERHGVAERVRLLAGDLLGPLPGPLDLIVSNPPYVPTDERAALPASVRDHEPRLALDGGPDGLALVRRLLAQAPAVLRNPAPVTGCPGGGLLIEIGANQGEAASRLARAFFPHATVRVHPDLAGRDRVLEVQMGQAFQPAEAVGQAFQPVEAVGQAFQPAEAVGQAFQPAEAVGQAFQPVEAVGQAFQPVEAVGQAFQPVEAVGQAFQPVEAVGQAFQPANTIRLLALDMDGTLMGEDLVISPRVRRAIATAQARGVVVTLATGRMLDFVLPFARDLKITAPLICYQGGVIQAAGSDVPLYRATMDPALVREVLELEAQYGWHAILYADDDVFLADRRHPDEFYHYMLGERLVWVDDLAHVLEQHEPVKLIIFVETDEAERVEAELRQRFVGRMEVARSHALIVEANPPGVSKVDALQRLAAHLRIPQSQVMAIGDQANDADMIAWAGVGVAMGNGSPATIAVADWVAPPLEEDGVAAAIERFILRQ
jgi:release factor glutamine methyltransferase